MEEKFFFFYNFKVSPSIVMQLPIHERRWFIERFIQQRQREDEHMQSATKGKK